MLNVIPPLPRAARFSFRESPKGSAKLRSFRESPKGTAKGLKGHVSALRNMSGANPTWLVLLVPLSLV